MIWADCLRRIGIRYYLLYKKDLHQEVFPRGPLSGYSYRELGAQDLPRFRPLVSPDRYQRLARRFIEGKSCYGILRGDEVVCYTWVSTKADPRMTRVVPHLAPDERYGFDTYCSPGHRRKGLATLCVQQRSQCLREAGIKRVYGFTEWDNHAMRRVYKKAGYRKVNGWFHILPHHVSARRKSQQTVRENSHPGSLSM